MKIVMEYKGKVLADEDRTLLMSNGVPAVVLSGGDSALSVLKDNFEEYGTNVILLVKDEDYEFAHKLILSKYQPDNKSIISKWLQKRKEKKRD